MLAGGLSHPEYTSNLHLWDGLEQQYGSTHGRYTFTNHASLRMKMYAKKKKPSFYHIFRL